MEKCTYCLQRITTRDASPPTATGRAAARRRSRDGLPGGVPDAARSCSATSTIRPARSTRRKALAARLRAARRAQHAAAHDLPRARRQSGREPAPGAGATRRRAHAGRTPALGVLRRRLRLRDHRDKIADIVLDAAGCTGAGCVGFAVSGALHRALPRRDQLAVREGRRHLGHQHAGRLGVRASTNFVWWIGIGHAGTFISAFLLLLRQSWRTSINRFAEAMTLFAVGDGRAVADPAPRPAVVLLLARPYPEHDEPVAAMAQPAGVGHLRDQHLHHRLAPVLVHGPDSRPRDAARPRAHALASRSPTACSRSAGAARRGTGAASRRRTCCWPGSRRRWWSRCTRVVSLDFAIGNTPGWHSTIFPPYFVAGALFSGFAMVLTLADAAAARVRAAATSSPRATSTTWRKLMLVTGLHRRLQLLRRDLHRVLQRRRVRDRDDRRTAAPAPYAPVYWSMILCNVVVPQVLWWRARAAQPCRRCSSLGLVVNVGMWLERFMIIVAEPAPRLPAVGLAHVLSDGLGLATLPARSARSRCCSCCSCASCRRSRCRRCASSRARSARGGRERMSDASRLRPRRRVRRPPTRCSPRRARARARLPRRRSLRAVRRRRPRRGARLRAQPRRRCSHCSAASPAALGGYFAAVVSARGRLPDQRRRPAAAQLAGRSSGDVRADGARRGARGVHRHARAATACRGCTIRSSTRPISTSRRATASSSACARRPGIRRRRRCARLLDALRPLRVIEVPA